MSDDNEFVFVALGGLGEIGMNCALYGYGPARARKWLMVDLGVAFAGDDLPGVDLILPDLGFIEKVRKDLVGVVLTHAHEDHIGALAELWPSLGVQVYASPFSAGLAEARRLGEPGAPKVPIQIVRPGGRVMIGPFDVEFVRVAHSIPESSALAIRTPAGLVVHTGDWKIDPTPIVGAVTDEARLAALGDEGVLALVCDSTNVLREGESPSERDVAATLADLVGKAKGRVVVTTFASNVARLRSAAEAGFAAGRQVCILGRAMERVVAVARELGMLDGVPPFLGMDAFGRLPRDKILALATGSQGEPRAALARMASDDHPTAELVPGDTVIFSSRTIPGNEKAVGKIINAFAARNVEVITDRHALVHVSGHPRRAEVAKMYGWLKPRMAVPAHGEALHLTEHVAFALAMGVPQVRRAFNGDLVRFAPGDLETIARIDHGRRLKDGEILLPAVQDCVGQRRRLSFAGVVSIAIALTPKGEMAGDPDVMIAGLPERTRDGAGFDGIIDAAIFETFESLPRGKRRDPDALSSAIERSVRASVGAHWGKKPQVHALVVEV
ncbi:ribonuclease J [Roseiarcus fermentans]|uniref:Ribonuclease J n=1 Tax=Roseiarcus fermentans TaxID=1473586 RepID=A0A366F3C8_9HYPH|nr:ribonuclease J [Roseiarcus fermentans]RBP09107.1 ribonuclease J [Roseiarcus fermentans]